VSQHNSQSQRIISFFPFVGEKRKTDTEGQFDLSTLSQHIEFEDKETRYELSICNKVVREDTNCFDLDHELLDTYTCAISRNNNIARSSGRVANVFYNEDVEPSITLHYSKGEPCGSGYSYTDVEFLCDLNYVHSYEGLSLVPSNDSCVTKFQWRNEAACRKCDLIARQGDYIKQNSECKDDVQHVSFVKAARCNGPVVLKTETQGCSESYPVTLPFVLLGLGLLFILVCVIIVVGIRNQKLSERYEMLVNDSISQRGSGPARDSGEV